MAIDDLLDEHEQEQRVRDWLRRNALSVVGGVAVGIVAIWGWQSWQSSRLMGSAADHARYQDVVAQIASSDLEKAADQLKALETDSSGIYADLAALSLAKAQVDAGKIDEAIISLRGVKPEGDFALIVNQRLARLLIEAGKADEALTVLGDAEDPASLEITGDAHVALDQREAAQDAYMKSVALLDADAPQRRLVEIKLSDVGGETPQSGAVNQ